MQFKLSGTARFLLTSKLVAAVRAQNRCQIFHPPLEFSTRDDPAARRTTPRAYVFGCGVAQKGRFLAVRAFEEPRLSLTRHSTRLIHHVFVHSIALIPTHRDHLLRLASSKPTYSSTLR